MAVLKESVSGGSSPFKDRIGDRVAPAGTWVAAIIGLVVAGRSAITFS